MPEIYNNTHPSHRQLTHDCYKIERQMLVRVATGEYFRHLGAEVFGHLMMKVTVEYIQPEDPS